MHTQPKGTMDMSKLTILPLFALSFILTGFVGVRRPTQIPAMDMETASKWLACTNRVPNAKQRLVCFPWAGGTSRVYDAWRLKHVEIVSVIMPGRDRYVLRA